MRLAQEADQYIATHYFPRQPLGTTVRGFRNENLEAMSFPDASIDLHVTQDVFEHVFDPEAAFREIARTLRPGGAHVFTVPLVRGAEPSRRRAVRSPDGVVTHLLPAEYHGNPVDSSGSLVTIDWGYDICAAIVRASGLITEIHTIDDLSQGIRAKYIEVLVTRKTEQ